MIFTAFSDVLPESVPFIGRNGITRSGAKVYSTEDSTMSIQFEKAMIHVMNAMKSSSSKSARWFYARVLRVNRTRCKPEFYLVFYKKYVLWRSWVLDKRKSLPLEDNLHNIENFLE